jgi:hypothetical protein
LPSATSSLQRAAHELQVIAPLQLSGKVPHASCRSSHVSGVHPQTPALHGPFAQSVLTLQANPGAHFGQVPPPQSTSVSAPFFDRSLQAGGLHVRAPPVPAALQIPLWQSRATRQGELSGHALQSGPPQSTPVSLASFFMSVQSVEHAGHVWVPPQPFETLEPHAPGISAQVSFWHVHTPLTHDLLAQSAALVHFFPFAHGEHCAPPQSMSVSVAFLTLSEQVGARHVRAIPSSPPRHTRL